MTPEEIVEFAEALARVSASGGGAKALAARLAQATGGGVLVEDAQWHHLATAGSAGIPASARAAAADRPLEDRSLREHLSAPGATLPIYAGSAHLGWLSLFGAPRANGTEYAMRLTSAAIAVELAREVDPGHGRRRTFWERLLAQAYHDANAARDDAAARGIVLAPHYLAIALEAESLDEARPAASAELRSIAGEALRGGDADLGLLDVGPVLLAFVPVSREIDASNARTAVTLLPKAASKRHPHLRLSGGTGTLEVPLAVHRSAESAQAALAIGRRLHGPGRVVVYDELGAYPLLYEGADLPRLCALAQRTLAPLRAYDEKHQTELERTLKLYFQVGENVKTAAAQLNVHRHTVFYRLRQIGEICAASLENPGDQLTLRLAVAIDELHS